MGLLVVRPFAVEGRNLKVVLAATAVAPTSILLHQKLAALTQRQMWGRGAAPGCW